VTKIHTAVEPHFRPVSPTLTPRGTVSFAEHMAGRESISAIASDRAFGFSETGLMGVPHGSKPSQVLHPPVTNEAPWLNAHLAKDDHRPVDRQLNLSGRLVYSAAEQERAPLSRTGQSQVATRQTVEDVLAQPLSKSPNDPFEPKQRLTTVRARTSQALGASETPFQNGKLLTRDRRSLSVTLTESEGDISVLAQSGEGILINPEEVIFQFSLLARQYGVTLKNVAVEGVKATFVQSIREGSA
jgi:hypothetical protein